MTTRIIEFTTLDPLMSAEPFVPMDKRVTTQPALTTTTSPSNSAVFNNVSAVICIQSDEAVYVALGAGPTATVNDYRIQAGQEQFFTVPPGAAWKASVRQ